MVILQELLLRNATEQISLSSQPPFSYKEASLTKMKIIPRFLLVFSLLSAVLARQETLAATGKIFVFRGRIQAVDAAARTFILQAEKKTYVFSVTDQTKIARNGATQGFTYLKRGQDAEVDMQIGSDGKGVALFVNLASRDLAGGDRYVGQLAP
jgi:hypothetical protein